MSTLRPVEHANKRTLQAVQLRILGLLKHAGIGIKTDLCRCNDTKKGYIIFFTNVTLKLIRQTIKRPVRRILTAKNEPDHFLVTILPALWS